jgi:hypothetical protein
VNGAGCGWRVGFGLLFELRPATADFAGLCFVFAGLCCAFGGVPTIDGGFGDSDEFAGCSDVVSCGTVA